MMKVSLNQFMKHHCLQTKNKVMDDFMVDWFGLDRVDDMSGNPHDEGANADDPRCQHTA
jgi:hypothetical protein